MGTESIIYTGKVKRKNRHVRPTEGITEISVNLKGVGDVVILNVSEIRESNDIERLLQEYAIHKSRVRIFSKVEEYELAALHDNVACVIESRLKVLASKVNNDR